MDETAKRISDINLPAVVSETHSSTCSQQQEPPKRPKIPTAVLKMITELGLRYRPSAQADLEAHASRIALLAQDMAEVPQVQLEYAIRMWVKRKPFMPKANELFAMIDEINSDEWLREHGEHSLQVFCDKGNAFAKRIGVDWWYRVVSRERNGAMIRTVEKLEGVRAMEARERAEGSRVKPYRPTPEDLASIDEFIQQCAANDLSQAEFNVLVRRTGGAPVRGELV